MVYLINIDETSKNNLKEEKSSIFNQEEFKFKTKKEVLNFLEERYTLKKIKNAIKNKKFIFNDSKKGVECVGITLSFWNKDYSHMSKSWYQTDWLSIKKVNIKPAFKKMFKIKEVV